MLRREFLSIFLAMLPMALAGGVQVLIPGIYLTWLAAAFSILILYIGIIVNQANTDHLTGLANRRRFDGRLQSALDRTAPERRWRWCWWISTTSRTSTTGTAT
jgi:GGDEF domain-containing protein